MVEQERRVDQTKQFFKNFYYGIGLSQNTDAAAAVFHYLASQYDTSFLDRLVRSDVNQLLSKLPLPSNHALLSKDVVSKNFIDLWFTFQNELNSYRRRPDSPQLEEISVKVIQRMIEKDMHYLDVGRPILEQRTDPYESKLRTTLFVSSVPVAFGQLVDNMKETLSKINTNSDLPPEITRLKAVVGRDFVNSAEYIRNNYPVLVNKWEKKHPNQQFFFDKNI